MNTFEVNKIIGAVLSAMLFLMFVGYVGNAIVPSPHDEGEPVYTVEVEVAADETASEDGDAAPTSALSLLASADVAGGEKTSKKCTACHGFEAGGGAKVGPNLWDIVGSDIAAADFAYSEALAGIEGDWTYEALDGFLADPKGWAPGTKMGFAGVKDVQDRAELIAWMRTQGDSAPPLPEVVAEEAAPAEATAAEATAPTDEQPAPAEEASEAGEQTASAETAEPADEGTQPADAGGMALADADLDAGKKVANKCKACHSFDEGGGNKVGPPLWDIVDRDIANADYSYSDALTALEGGWTYAALDAYLADPKGYAPGTKMAFAGVKKEEDRVNLIAWMRSLSNDPAPLPGGDRSEAPAAEEAPATDTAGGTMPTVPTDEEEGIQSAEPAIEPGPASPPAVPTDEEDGILAASPGLVAMLTNADLAAGEATSKKCAACHNVAEGAGRKIGPNLWDVVGRPVASVDGFSYSPAMQEFGGDWTYDRLFAFLEAPRSVVSGTKMGFPGIKDDQELADLIAWLRTRSGEPVPLPE